MDVLTPYVGTWEGFTGPCEFDKIAERKEAFRI